MAPIDPHSFTDSTHPLTTHISLTFYFDFPSSTISSATLLSFSTPYTGPLTLDTRSLSVSSVLDPLSLSPLPFSLSPTDPILGQSLNISISKQTHQILILSKTSPSSSALQWLSPTQTFNKNHPFLYTHCQPIHARSIFPCQDTPVARVKYTAKLNIPRELSAVMAARHVKRRDPIPSEAQGVCEDSVWCGDDRVVEEFVMEQPIPPYLFAFAIGELGFREVGPRTRVYAEAVPEVLDAAATEFAGTEEIVMVGERLFGPYEWERFDLLVLPPSFPLGGMENPRLVFLTPTVIKGDASGSQVVAHELAHGWTGNLITNKNNEHFWLNEGFTTYAERRIVADPSDNNPSSQQSLPYITSNNPLQFTIHLPNSTPNFTSIPNSNPSHDPNPNPSPNPHSDSISDQLLSLSIPTKRRRGRPRSTTTSSLDQFSKTLVENSNLVRNLTARKNTASFDASDEIIVINKEATTEALIALTAGFPADSLTDEEIEAEVVSVVGGIEQVNYILIRNHILMKWRVNVSTWITKEMFFDVIPKHCNALLDSAHNYLVSRGYINFGVVPAIKDRIPAEPSKPSVIIIGAGLAGLAAARQLMLFGFKVTVLEGRKRAGGRVYSKKMEGGNKVAAADLGGSVLTGTLGNPLGILARQLSCTLHKVRDKCPLYRVDGKPVDQDLDHKVETAYNLLLEKASKLRQLMGEVSQDVSLGAALETFRQDYEDAVNEEEMSLFNWHLANLEYANAGLISKLSLAFWDQDDPFDMGGDHCFLPGGNGKLVHALTENIPILYEKIVHTIRYGTDGVQVGAGAQVFEGDMVLCTVPLGVLKGGSIKFMPELPQRKLDGIKRLGFGLLNKVAMLFPYVFWGTDLDTFGHLTDNSSSRGEFFLFYSYATVAGGPLLLALVAGEAAHKFETMPPTDAVTKVLQILKGIYEPQGIEVPEPIQTVCTRWGSDPFSLGSYSNVAVGASGDDYDILAESVGDGRLFFAGEATNRRYPATMHGAFLSGLREAANIAHHAKARTMSLKIEKKPSKSTHYYASVLDDLFREPDLEFGSFSIIFARKSSDLESPAILRVTFCGPQTRNHDGIRPGRHLSNKLLFQQLQSQFNNQHELHVYTLLSKQQALDLREVRGGDEMRLNFLSEKLGVKLVGRKGLGPSVDSIIASVKAERGRRKPGTLKSGVMKSKDTTLKRKIVRKAKVVSGSNRTTSSPASSSRIKAVGSSTTTIHLTNVDLEPKPICAIGSVASPSLNIRVNDDMGSKSVGSSVHLLHNASIGDKFEGNFGSSTAPLLNVGGNTGSNSDGPIYPKSTYDDSTDTCAPPTTGNLASQHTSGDGDMESMMLDGEYRM